MHNHVGGEINMCTCGWEYVNVCTLHCSVCGRGSLGVCVGVGLHSRWFPPTVKGDASYLKKIYIMDENDPLSEYNKIPLGHSRTNGAVYSKIYFKVEICSAH